MKTSQSFQFYPTDFIMGTAMMSCEQRGAYIALLCHQWENGGLRNHMVSLALLCGTSEQTIEEVIQSKFEVGSDGLLRNKRLEEVRRDAEAYRKSRSYNGRKGGRPTKAHGKHMESICFSHGKHMKSPPSPSPSTPLTPQGGDSEELVADEEWLDRLSRNPTYADLDIPAEFAKARDACNDAGRQLTRRRFIGHLAKVEKPPPPRKPYAPKDVYDPGPPITEEARLERLRLIREAKASLTPNPT